MLDGCRPASPPSVRAHSRLRADQAHAGAAGVVVHFPVGGEEGVDVAGREEVGCAMRAVEHADVPVSAVGRNRPSAWQRQRPRCRMPGAARCSTSPARRCAPAVAAELAQREGAAAAQVEPARRSRRRRPGSGAQPARRSARWPARCPALTAMRLPHGDRLAIERERRGGAGHARSPRRR